MCATPAVTTLEISGETGDLKCKTRPRKRFVLMALTFDMEPVLGVRSAIRWVQKDQDLCEGG